MPFRFQFTPLLYFLLLPVLANARITVLTFLPSPTTHCAQTATISNAGNGLTVCDAAKNVTLDPGTDVTLVWQWESAAGESAAPEGMNLDFLLKMPNAPPSTEISIARNITPFVPPFSYSFKLPSSLSKVEGAPFRITATYNSATILTPRILLSSPNAANPPAPTTPKVNYILLIIGITSVLALVALIGGFFVWKRHVRNRPGYERRKMQRKTGVSVISCQVKRLWREGAERMHWGEGKREDHNRLTPELPDVEKGVQRPSPCFRPSGEYVPPGLCKTYTWQHGEKVQIRSSPLRENSDTTLGSERRGWDSPEPRVG